MENGDNPCWQDLYDDDCSMTSVYAASFVASKWIKGMPCAAGIEVCQSVILLLLQTNENRISCVPTLSFGL